MTAPIELVRGAAVPFSMLLADGLANELYLVAASDGEPVDVVALLLGEDRKVRADEDLVFYNNRASVDRTVALDSKGYPRMRIVLAELAPDVHRIVLGAASGSLEDGAHHEIVISISAADHRVVATGRCQAQPDYSAMSLVELYRHPSGWRCRLLDEGYEEGLAALVTDYGVDVRRDDDAPQTSANPEPRSDDLVTAVLDSPVYQAQVARMGRYVPRPANVGRLLRAALAAPGCRLDSAAAAAALGVSVVQLLGALAQIQRLLNVEQYPVLRRDVEDGSVTVDVGLLREQFGLAR